MPRVGTFKYRATKMKSKVEKIHNKQLQKSRNTWEQKRICRPLVFQILPFVWHQKIVHAGWKFKKFSSTQILREIKK